MLSLGYNFDRMSLLRTALRAVMIDDFFEGGALGRVVGGVRGQRRILLGTIFYNLKYILFYVKYTTINTNPGTIKEICCESVKVDLLLIPLSEDKINSHTGIPV